MTRGDALLRAYEKADRKVQEALRAGRPTTDLYDVCIATRAAVVDAIDNPDRATVETLLTDLVLAAALRERLEMPAEEFERGFQSILAELTGGAS